MTAHHAPDDPLPAHQRQLDAFFERSQDGFFFITLDTPLALDEQSDPDAILNSIVDHQRVTRVNDALLRLYRAEPGQISDRAQADMFLHGVIARRNVWWQLFATGNQHVETIQIRADGTSMWVEGDYGCFYDHAGHITGYFGVQRDVTSRKQSERALREAELQYRALFEQSQDAVFILKLNGQLLAANHRAAELLGYTVDEMAHLSMRDMSAQPDESSDVIDRLLRGEKVPLYERLFRKKTGELIRVEIDVSLVSDADEMPLHIQSVARDISQRRQMEDALRLSESRQRALLAAMPDLMFRIHRDGRYLDYHARSENDMAIPPDGFLGKHIADVMPDAMSDISMDYLERTLATNTEQVFEYTMGRSATTLRYFEARMVACAPDEVLTIVRDVTERKRAEQREFALKLEKERVELITRFIQDASHEFRTPLAIINNSLYFLGRAPGDDRRETHLDRAENQIARMTRLVDMLLLISRLDSESPFSTAPVNLNRLLREVITSAGSLPEEKSLVLHLDLSPELPPVNASAEYLLNALSHLLDNAIRYTPAGGHIRVTSALQDNYAIIEIEDTGSGMDETVLAHIFERFWRRDDAHTTPGLGLGLPIAQKIIERHGGKIEVQSTLGVGSIFTVFLPVLPVSI